MLRSSRSAVTVVSRLTISGTIQSQSRIHTSIAVSKVKKNEKKKDVCAFCSYFVASTVLHAVSSLHSSDSFVQKALAEMTEVERILKDELAKHFSLQVDLRVYEDITVKLENGQERKMSYLGRVSLKNSQLVMITMETRGSQLIEIRRKELLTEVA
uniref:Ribosome-recycling factor, mitochondrial n=1 Tax=Heterorhabditis bacteriophora TaxID=37862 RepID=A0A1I7W8W9_HETBA